MELLLFLNSPCKLNLDFLSAIVESLPLFFKLGALPRSGSDEEDIDEGVAALAASVVILFTPLPLVIADGEANAFVCEFLRKWVAVIVLMCMLLSLPF